MQHPLFNRRQVCKIRVVQLWQKVQQKTNPPAGIHNRKACKGLGQGLFERLRKIIYNPRTDAQTCKAELFTVDCPRVEVVVVKKVSEGQR